MPILSITNNSPNVALIYDPDNTVDFMKVQPATTAERSVDAEFLEAVKDQLDAFRLRTDTDGAPLFVIDIRFDGSESGENDYALGDVTVWVANHVGYDLEVTNPTTASVVGARRTDHAAGEAYVGGKFFRVAATTNVVGDAEIDVDGTDVSSTDLTASEDVYQHLLLVNNAGSLEKVYVRGVSAAAGTAVALLRSELAAAVGAHLGDEGPNYGFVEIARILFEEDGGLTQTTTDIRWTPASYI